MARPGSSPSCEMQSIRTRTRGPRSTTTPPPSTSVTWRRIQVARHPSRAGWWRTVEVRSFPWHEETDVMPPQMTLTATVLDAPDARQLAAFYRRLLGWTARADEPDWVALSPPGGGAGLSFQTEPAYVRPAWPAGQADQQMM